ncbi:MULTISPECIES: ribonuclease HII [unclassified Prevotella]|uniref:ribonuclease HII n=1 Tax=unclassified Prevotella TaxID=2638335 RepID=UPI00048EA99C|nr:MULTISPECIES: ribonuclease HII [unclassified Prevotella]
MLASHYYEGKIEAGCDEAGRGCLAGSVYAAAVILPDGYQNELLNDSKQLSEKKRYQLREMIERDAVAWAVGIVTPEEIDKINILNASILAMHRALDQLKVRPEAVIVDGNKFKPYKDPADGKPLPHTTIVKGDGKYLAIAAASILAKTYRDDYMNQLAEEYPQYDWLSNKGYPTKKHREAIRQFGITPYHRKSYNLLGDGQLSIDFGEF